jgi:hypothetical protein
LQGEHAIGGPIVKRSGHYADQFDSRGIAISVLDKRQGSILAAWE